MSKSQLAAYARLPHHLVHAPLFRSLPKSGRRRMALDVKYSMGDSGTIFHFQGPEQLGVIDLRVLQGLAALASLQRHKAGVKQVFREGRVLRSDLQLKQDAAKDRIVAIRFHVSLLARTIGYARPSGRMITLLQQSITRLCAVDVHVNGIERNAGYRLAAFRHDEATGQFVVGLSPCLTAPLFEKHGYLRVSMDEVRNLSSDAAHLIHSRLHWINQGASKAVKLPTLCDYVYGNASAATDAIRQRHATTRKALEDMINAGWSWHKVKADAEAETTSNLIQITRPLKREDDAS